MATSSNNWTRAELETMTPFESAAHLVDDKLVPMTRQEYDAWIESGVGQPKRPAHLPPEITNA